MNTRPSPLERETLGTTRWAGPTLMPCESAATRCPTSCSVITRVRIPKDARRARFPAAAEPPAAAVVAAAVVAADAAVAAFPVATPVVAAAAVAAVVVASEAVGICVPMGGSNCTETRVQWLTACPLCAACLRRPCACVPLCNGRPVVVCKVSAYCREWAPRRTTVPYNTRATCCTNVVARTTKLGQEEEET